MGPAHAAAVSGQAGAAVLPALLLNYFVVEINVGSLCGLVGPPMFVFGFVARWRSAGRWRARGTIGLARSVHVGFQLLLVALFYDVQFSTPTRKLRRERARPAAAPVRPR